MSRILKRPMFRKGGSPNKGIMTGLVDRKKYANGIDKEELAKNVGVLEEVLEQYTPKTRVPYGAFGLDIATGTPVLEAFKKRYGQFTTADDKREAAIKGGAAKLGIAKALEKPKVGTPKSVRNTSNQELFGIKPGDTGFVSAQQLFAVPGALKPIDNRMAFTFNPDTGVVEQQPVSEVDRKNKNIANAKQIVSAVNTVGKIKDKMINDLNQTPTGPVGSFYGILEATSSQFSQAAQGLGFNQNSLNFDINTSEKLDKYLQKKGVTKGAANYAKMKGSVINLAYLLAKIKEPGNPRLSEGDIIRQLDRLKFGASKDVFAATLNNVFDDEVIGAEGQIRGYDLNPDDFFNPKKSKKNKLGTETKSEDTDNDPADIRKFIK